MKTLLMVMVLLIGLAATAIFVYADVRSAQYKGSAVCMMCHKNTNAAITQGYQNSPHAKTMQKADAPGVIVADFSVNSAFGKDKVAYVLGVGRNEQAYLDANYQVLPAVWDVKSKSWKPTAAVDGASQCIACHSTGYDPAQKSSAQLGVSCESCHGPGSEHVSAPGKTTIKNPRDLSGKDQAMVCGQCHSAGKDTTGKFAFSVSYRPGDDLAKSFVDGKPTTAGRNQQYSEYIQSKHSQIGLSCTTCHDPHNTVSKPGQLKKPVVELCLGCHAGKVKDMATHAPAAPAGATCATCHMPGGRHTFTQPGK